MILWIVRFIHKLIVLLNSGDSPNKLSIALTIGFIAGLIPFNIIITTLLFLILFIGPINFSAGLFAYLIIRLFAGLIDPISHSLGYYLLVDIHALKPFWTMLYNAPIIPLTKFNNTLVLGSLTLGIILSPIFFILLKLGIVKYRTSLQEKVKKSKLFKLIKSSTIAKWYSKVIS